MSNQDETFKDFCQRMVDIHEKKAHDYSKDGDRFSNFKRAAEIASWFNDPVDKVFATMVGTKLSRLAELLNGKIPKNESIDDTFLDNTTYSAIWFTWFNSKKPKKMTLAEVKRLYNFKVTLKDLKDCWDYEDTSSKASTRRNNKVRTQKPSTRNPRVKGRKSCRSGLQP